MPDRPLIVISLEGFARNGLSCYGCSWNRTPAIDAIAGGGCVYDRVIASTDDDRELLQGWWQAHRDWATAWREHGSMELITDGDDTASRQSCFDQVIQVDGGPMPHEPVDSVEDIADTAMGRLVAAAAQRDSEPEPWNLMWLHSDFLTRCWDAPRTLLPGEELDPEINEPPVDPSEINFDSEDDGEEERLPLVFDQVDPPELLIPEDPHPDLITSWMRTYACQIRLVDLLIEVLLGSLQVDDPQLILVGTSGFRLGQGDRIGHALGSPRSADLQLPLIVSDCGPIRVPQLMSSDVLPGILAQLGREEALVDAAGWSQAEPSELLIRTVSGRADTVLTTPEWFYVREHDETQRLYLKPDDVDDFNDVSRVRDDVTKELQQRA